MPDVVFFFVAAGGWNRGGSCEGIKLGVSLWLWHNARLLFTAGVIVMADDISELAILKATEQPWQLLYQDEQLLVVNKPARLLTVPGRHPDNSDCLISRVQREFPQAQVVHRLDYDTSGLVILPLTKAALSDISKQFQARTVHKDYQALVSGMVNPAEGSINLPIAADPERRPLYKICQQSGKASLTHYRTLSFDQGLQQSRLLLSPVTGRSHQLRLHLSAIGHAILGDSLYAPKEVAAKAERLCLHAAFIEFNHPVTGERMQFSAAPEF